MLSLRPYQLRACDQAYHHLLNSESVVVVAPTGSGKSVMAQSLAEQLPETPLVLSHRREIIDQLQARGLKAESVQGFIRNPTRHRFGIIDECHHFAADEWKTALSHIQTYCGFTATPVRADGKPLGNHFSHMVIAAKTSELIADGHLISPTVIAPSSYIGPDLAEDPVSAYLRRADKDADRAFCYVGGVDQAIGLAKKFTESTVPAMAIYGYLEPGSRKQLVAAFRDGTNLKMLINVYILTEGVDVPEASVVILARGCTSPAAYLQMVGRVMRPHPSKSRALVIDLTGACHLHGAPDLDREYSLERGIELPKPIQVFQCPACGMAFPSSFKICPLCGTASLVNDKRRPRIVDAELSVAWAGKQTEEALKRKELARLWSEKASRNLTYYWLVREYKKLFTDHPPIHVEEEEKQKELSRHLGIARAKGFKDGWATWRFKEAFGHWPNRKWIGGIW